MDDAAVVEKDQDGKVQVKNQDSRGTWIARAWAASGPAPRTVFFPIGGLVLGLAGGAPVGRMLNTGVDGKFVKEVQDELKPGTSALFILVNKAIRLPN